MNCLFCEIILGNIPSTTVYENEYLKVIMDINPSVDGHLLIITKAHFENYQDLDKELLFEINKASEICYQALEKELGAKGMSLVTNVGLAQDIKHTHYHIIPTYEDIRGIEFNENGNSSSVKEIANKIINGISLKGDI